MKVSRKNKHFLPSQFSDLLVLLQLLMQWRSFFILFYFCQLRSNHFLLPKWISTFLTAVICGVMKQNTTGSWKLAVWDVKSVTSFPSLHISQHPLPNLNIKRRCHCALLLRRYRLTSSSCLVCRDRQTRIVSKREEMKDRWENRRDRWRERQPGRGGRMVRVVVMVIAMARVAEGGRGGSVAEGCYARLWGTLD